MNTTNLHMMHAEDCVVFGNMDNTCSLLYSVFDFIQNKTNSLFTIDPFKLTIKYDGSPAIFAWSKFPGLNMPGVATKGLFNKTPIIYTKIQDILSAVKFNQMDLDLAYKLKKALNVISNLNIPDNQIWQGDILFDDKTLKKEDDCYYFHPNTIIYKIPKDLEQKAINAKLGIVWHTKYIGTSIETATADYNIDVSVLKNNGDIFIVDYKIDKHQLKPFSLSEARIIDSRFCRAQELMKFLNNDTYRNLISDNDFVSLFKIYQNYVIKQNIGLMDIKSLQNFIRVRFDKDCLLKKSDKGKQIVQEKREKILNLIEQSKDTINLMFRAIINFQLIKEIYIKKFNEIQTFETYLKYKNGNIMPTSQEGYVLSDINGNAIKLVNREEFSYANFSDNVVKGWTKK